MCGLISNPSLLIFLSTVCSSQNKIYFIGTIQVDFHHKLVFNFIIKVNCIRAWDYPKIAGCTDTGCACYSLKIPFVSEVVLAFQSGLWYTVVGRMKAQTGKGGAEIWKKNP